MIILYLSYLLAITRSVDRSNVEFGLLGAFPLDWFLFGLEKSFISVRVYGLRFTILFLFNYGGFFRLVKEASIFILLVIRISITVAFLSLI